MFLIIESIKILTNAFFNARTNSFANKKEVQNEANETIDSTELIIITTQND